MTEKDNMLSAPQPSTSATSTARVVVPDFAAAWDRQFERANDAEAQGTMILERFPAVTGEHVHFLIELGAKQRLLEYAMSKPDALKGIDTAKATSRDLIDHLSQTTGEGRKFLSKLAAAGARRKLVKFRQEVIAFDELHGTTTTTFMSEEAYQIEAREHPEHFQRPEHVAEGVKHRSSLTETVLESVRQAQVVLRESGYSIGEANFVDLGSGEGKPVMIAGSPHYGFAFREVYGVDYSEDKIKAARKNVEAFNETASPDDAIDPDRVKFEWSSAADWHRGYGGVNVIYTYNSFGPNIMAEVEYRMRRNGGASVFIYDKPLHRQIFEDNGWEQRHEIVHRSDEDKRVAIYSFGLDR